MPRHFLDLMGITPGEARRLIDQSIEIKRDEQWAGAAAALGPDTGAALEKPSLRTRVSFEAAIAR